MSGGNGASHMWPQPGPPCSRSAQARRRTPPGEIGQLSGRLRAPPGVAAALDGLAFSMFFAGGFLSAVPSTGSWASPAAGHGGGVPEHQTADLGTGGPGGPAVRDHARPGLRDGSTRPETRTRLGLAGGRDPRRHAGRLRPAGGRAGGLGHRLHYRIAGAWSSWPSTASSSCSCVRSRCTAWPPSGRVRLPVQRLPPSPR